MGKLTFSFTNFIGIKVGKIKLPPYIDLPYNLRSKYGELLPEISTMVRPYFYIATSEKSEASYIREMEGIPDLFPLVAYPGSNVDNNATIISMIGLYINELTESGIDKVESACQIIEQALTDVGLEFSPESIEIVMMIPKFSIDLSEDFMEEQETTLETIRQEAGPKKGQEKHKKPYIPKPITIGDMLGVDFVNELYKKVSKAPKT